MCHRVELGLGQFAIPEYVSAPQVAQMLELKRDEFALGHGEDHDQLLELEAFRLLDQEEHQHERDEVQSREEGETAPAVGRAV